jgi:plastocyanin
MRTIARMIGPLTLVVTLVACAACAGSTNTPTATATNTTFSAPVGATVSLGASSFARASVTISAGQAVRFVDPASGGGAHKLCVGSGGTCDDTAQDPAELVSPGLSFAPGSTQSVPFLHPGSYAVTCTIHPSMQLTISVLGTGG